MAKAKFSFPLLGKNENWSASTQPALTSPDLLNVRPYDVQDNRARGGQRPGLSKRYAAAIGTNKRPVIALAQINVTHFD